MYWEAQLLPNTLGSTIAFPLFREAIGKLLHVSFCGFFFFFFFLRFALYLRKGRGHKEVVTSALKVDGATRE
jgi:hypothetical protein